ncbi:MAG: recombination protein RecR [Acidobacteria bacterium RIFCSPLOWO2_02_FULL_61_28]|nr:MAG: recombination protein RecR [Acidobacteria bacterium RIFCSPLOWO2_02_FULL_61_28]
MPEYAEPMARLIEELRRLPGIGSKSAQRIAFHLLKAEPEDTERLAAALRDLKQNIRLCEVCNNFTDISPCAYCADASRDSRLLCVIEEPANIVQIEKTGKYRGRYHVLHGTLSPLQGIGPDQLRIANLLERVNAGGVEEIIVATNPNVEGEATAMYLSKLLKPLGVRVTRIAMGIPVGGELEYTDSATVAKAMEGRKEL